MNNVFGNVYQYAPEPGGGGGDCRVLEPEDVRFGVSYGDEDALVGVLELPTEPQVLMGVGYGSYGTEFTGSLQDAPGGSGSVYPPVLISGGLRSPLVVGDDYTADVGRAFIWTVTTWSGFDPGLATATFQGRDVNCGCDQPYEWDVEGEISDNGDGSFDVKFELPSEVTEMIAAGTYKWWFSLDDVTLVSSNDFGNVIWVCS